MMTTKQIPTHITLFLFTIGSIFLLLAFLLFNTSVALGQEQDDAPLHPSFAFLDTDGNNVLDTGNPISTLATCGTCHDTAFISEHSVHADAGLSLIGNDVSREWQLSNGWYGGWNPINYGYLSPDDLELTEWIQTYGLRHAGGGPAEEAGIEMNCFLCHAKTPNNEARIAELEAGNFAWADTATLGGSGIVEASGDTWLYNTAAFDDKGELLPEYVALGGEPTNANCGQCHGVADGNTQIPLIFDPFDASQWNTLTTGQVFSPQRISNSGMNIENKDELAHSWDVHAERVVDCVDCHYSLNNPVFYIEGETSRPDHLQFDPRRMEFGDYLSRPLHQFANGGLDYVDAFPVFEEASRDCASCHDAVSTHTWLPYAESHTEALACETCHIPELNAPALQSVDWTVLDAEGNAVMSYRGVDTSSQPALLTGYQPVLLPQADGDNTVLAPYNLVSAWYWVYGEPVQPVPLETLQSAWFEDGNYAPEILSTFDSNNDGLLDNSELIIDSDEKETLIAERLIALGMEEAHIVSEVEAYAVHHNVTYGDWATSACETCHAEDSRLTATMPISDRTPGGVEPTFIASNGTTLNGELISDDNGVLYYAPQFDIEPTSMYVFGNSNISLIDWFGVIMFLATLIGVMAHGGLRYMMLRRMPEPEEPELREVYMYSIYERQWHWLQTVVIFGLIFTGLVIHKPEMFGIFSFRYNVLIHNALSLILVINAALAAFYHLVSGEIQQFLPEPRGFFGKMFAQARYYLWGIFRNEPHPFEKTPQQKMNPIQQVTYFGLLNVLLPLQVITGALMWGVQRWPDLTASLGGLPFLAPFHSLVAWSLSTFIVLHVYMTTTGHTPIANIKAMIFGWDEVEVHNHTGEQNS